jgi:asparagine synthase (glutamine-hydrolysing)
MCGIAGIFGIPQEAAVLALDRMLDQMAHRGPDDRGTADFVGGATGMVRLALVDLSERGRQPFWSCDRRTAVLFNGEIYNFREERRRLESNGYRFRSGTDTEVVLALYLERGVQFVNRLRGMFAIAVLDWRFMSTGPPTVVLARDPFGIKPLYVVSLDGGGFAFSSEVRALLGTGLVDPIIDDDGLRSFLERGFVAEPKTLIRGVRMFSPGVVERFLPGQAPDLTPFAAMSPAAAGLDHLPTAADELRAILEESVSLHAFADAKVGAFLSGGLDSSTIVALMRPHVSDLRTYSLKPVDHPYLDESPMAEATASHFDCAHTTVEISDAEATQSIHGLAASLDQPSCDGLNTWLVARAAARDVKGVLSGLGADEFFGGYPVTGRIARLDTLAGRQLARASAIVDGSPLARLSPLQGVASRRSPLTLWLRAHAVFRSSVVDRMLGSSGPSEDERLAELLDSLEPGWRAESMVTLASILDTRVYMGHQLLRDSDAASMAHSLELRVPFVDIEIQRFARSCPDHFKVSVRRTAGGRDKRVLREAVRGLLPQGFSSRPKRGFALPYDAWIDHAAADLVWDATSEATIMARGLVDVTGIPEPLSSYPQKWALMILELWCRAVLDGVGHQ